MSLMQLLMAVGLVQITLPAVDYDSYLSHGADCHSEGLSKFFTITLLHYITTVLCAGLV